MNASVALGPAVLLTAVLVAPPPPACLSAVLHPEGVAAPVLLVAGLGLLVHALASWIVLVAALTLGARVPARAGRACAVVLRRCAPAGVRRAVALALGAGLALGLPVPAAQAMPAAPGAAATTYDWPGLAPTDPGPTPTPTPTGTQPPAGLPTARPPATAPPAPGRPVSRARPASAPEAVVVRAGDTLWALSAHSLPRPVADADRAAEWPRWWTANRDVVGDDPHLLHPGQRLVAPPPP